MNYRRFGRTGWKVSEIGYGMWGLAGWTGSDDAETMASLQRAVELGCNFFDTAWAYGDGKSEQILAKLLRESKNKAGVGGPDKHLYVATKIPPKNRKWPSRRDFSSGRLLSAGVCAGVRGEEPEEFVRRYDRSDAVPHLGRPLAE